MFSNKDAACVFRQTIWRHVLKFIYLVLFLLSKTLFSVIVGLHIFGACYNMFDIFIVHARISYLTRVPLFS